jgi:hypothetical protein
MSSGMHYGFDWDAGTRATELAACKRVNDVLQREFPGHPWHVGVDEQAGYVVIRLDYPRLKNFPFGHVLYPWTVDGPDGDRRIRNAGGDWLERWNLLRGPATENSFVYAKENGLDFTGAIWKSKA